MRPDKQLDQLLHQAFDIALEEVERRARKIMQYHPGVRFTMAMGLASFYGRNGEPLDDDTGYLQPFYKFLGKYDGALKITGYPLKLTSFDGPRVKDW